MKDAASLLEGRPDWAVGCGLWAAQPGKTGSIGDSNNRFVWHRVQWALEVLRQGVVLARAHGQTYLL